jgi:hypothetical protein
MEGESELLGNREEWRKRGRVRRATEVDRNIRRER